MDVTIEASWNEKLKEEFSKSYFLNLVEFLEEEQKSQIIYPPSNLVFNAFELCPFDKTRVVIIGQDPYHGSGQANGLSFSVNDGVKFPPSLRNIFKELYNDIGKEAPMSGNLEKWARQGVLMLNATLTVRAKEAGSHQGKGWEEFTDQVIKVINEQKEGVAFVLWGAYAQKKGSIIDQDKHFVVESPHPSPFSARNGFLGSKPFSKINQYLMSRADEPIIW